MPERQKGTKDHIEYFKEGGVKAQGKFVDGLMEGYWEWFRRDGSKMRTGHFTKGEQSGVWTTYARDGVIVKVTDFDKMEK
jgi:antitoxin component YwqK of YwqJK toxin-antitoxin module